MLEVDHVCHMYEGNDFALRGVSFALPRGQIVGLLGENGAGKTTLMRCILGLIRPDEGSITLDGQRGEQIRAKMSYVSGAGSSFGMLTPRQTGEFDMPRYLKLLSFFSLPDRPVRHMSTGERAKAELAAGFSRGADYILLDEPFSGKDVFTRHDFLKIMAGSLRGSETILLGTHLVEEVENVLDRVLVLHEGRLAADVELDALRSRGETLMDLMRAAAKYDETRAARLFAGETR